MVVNYTNCALLSSSDLPKLSMENYCIAFNSGSSATTTLESCLGTSDVMMHQDSANPGYPGCLIYAHYSGSVERAYACLDGQGGTTYSYCSTTASAAPSLRGGKTTMALGAMIVAAVIGGALF